MYSILSHNSDKQIIGINNSGHQAEILKDNFSRGNYEKLMEHWGGRDSWRNKSKSLPEGVFLEHLKLRDKAKLTDFMSYAPILVPSELLISKRVKDIFDQFNLYGVNYVQANVYTTDDIHAYYLLVLRSIPTDWISFQKSILKDDFEEKELIVDTLEAYKKQMLSEPLWGFKKLSLTHKFDVNIDLFMGIDGSRFVSEKLRKALRSSGVSALNITSHTEMNRCPEIVLE